MTTLPRFGKIVQATLYVHIPLILFVGTAYLVHLPTFGQGGMDARKVAAFAWAFAVLLFLAARQLAKDARWLHPVVAAMGLHWLVSSYEFLGRGDRNFLPPFLVQGALLAVYVAGAIVLARSRAAPAGGGEETMTRLPRFGKTVRTLLYLQILMALFVGMAYLVHLPTFGQGGMDARNLTAFLWQFAVLLFLAARRFAGDPRWLYAVIAVVGLNLLDSAYELLGRGDTTFLPPFVIEGVLLATYVTAAFVLPRPAAPGRARARAPASE